METLNYRCCHFAGLENLFCDGRVRTEDGWEFPVHRIILSSKSDYFKALFGSVLNSKPQQDVLIRHIKGSTFKDILSYVYTGNVNINSNTICDFIEASDYFLMNSLLNECCIFVPKTISPENCFRLLQIAVKFEHLGICTICFRYVQTHFGIVMAHPDLKDLPLHILTCLLTNDNLDVESEEQVWTAITMWLSKNTDNRVDCILSLLSCLRFSDTTEEIIQKIISHPYVLKNKTCGQLLHLTIHSTEVTLKNRFIQAVQQLSSEPLCFSRRKTWKRFFFINYSHFPNNSTMYLTYDVNLSTWLKIGTFCHSILRIPHQSMVAIDHIIFMFYPCEGIYYKFDLLHKIWLEAVPMNENRVNYSIAKIDDCIYCIGGRSANNFTSSTVERYDYAEDQWTRVCPMLTIVEEIQSVTLNGLIYMIGEIEPQRFDYVLVAQVYDPSTNSWVAIRAPCDYRSHFALVAFDNSIFILGGYQNHSFRRSTLRYDVRENVWRAFEELPATYTYPRAIVMNGVLTVYNGEDEYNDAPAAPVYWDDNNNAWKLSNDTLRYSEFQRNQFCEVSDAELNRMHFAP